jgi:hypothetical protein
MNPHTRRISLHDVEQTVSDGAVASSCADGRTDASWWANPSSGLSVQSARLRSGGHIRFVAVDSHPETLLPLSDVLRGDSGTGIIVVPSASDCARLWEQVELFAYVHGIRVVTQSEFNRQVVPEDGIGTVRVDLDTISSSS